MPFLLPPLLCPHALLAPPGLPFALLPRFLLSIYLASWLLDVSSVSESEAARSGEDF